MNNSMINSELLSRLSEAEKYFIDTRFERCVKEALRAYDNDESAASDALDNLPTKAQLLQQLIEKLKGKSVYQTLRKIDAGHSTPEDFLKAMFSLGAHIVIECQQGNKEYRILLPLIQEQIGELIYNIS